MDKSYTLLETMIITIIIAILAAVAYPQYTAMKERALDKEAKAVLGVIREAERIFKMESPTSVYAAINDPKLRLSLSASSSWTYSADITAGTVTATRNTGSRSLTVPICCETPTCPAVSCALVCTGTCYYPLP